jgi:four helix bundle protein
MQDFRQLSVWNKAHQLVLAIYKETGAFPEHEKYGLTSQVRRAVVSIPTNIAEGCGRNSNPDLARFLSIAMGSASEVEYQIILARDLGYITPEDANRLEDNLLEVKRMLNALLRKVQQS